MRVLTKRAVFLDRDGTLIIDGGYIYQISQAELLPGVVEALTRLQKLGFELIVVSNQSGIGRGFFTNKEVDAVNQYLQDLLGAQGVTLKDFYYCPHHPEDKCFCRKPQPGLLLKALTEHHIEAKHSYFVGDQWTDVQAALAAGVQPVLLSLDPGVAVNHVPVVVVDSLLTWARGIELEDKA